MWNSLEQQSSPTNISIPTDASNDAIFDIQKETWWNVLKITKLWWFTQIILSTLEKIKDPALKIKELQEARANLCKIDPEDCANDDLHKMSA